MNSAPAKHRFAWQKGIGRLLLLLVILLGTAWLLRRQPTVPPPVGLRESTDVNHVESHRPPFDPAEARFLFPEMVQVVEHDDHFFKAVDDQGQLLGLLVFGPPDEADIVGFAGRVPFLIGFDHRLRITGVHLLPSQETPQYARNVADSLKNAWNHLTAPRAAQREVDTVTGATRTSRALIQGVRKTLARLDSEAQFEPGMLPFAEPARTKVLDLMIALFLIIAIAWLWLPRRVRHFRLGLSLASLAIPGLLGATMLSLATLGSWLRFDLPRPSQWLLALIGLAAFALPILTGRNFYCSNFCPFGAAQELAGRVKRKKSHPGKNLRVGMSIIRLSLLLSAWLLLVAGSAFDLSLIEPFVAFRWLHAAWPSRILAVGFLLLAVWTPRPWCRICPTGALLEAMRRRR